jgi:hypothetical protein
MRTEDLVKQIKETNENIILVYAFNSTGKTRLSVAYKDYTKSLNEGKHVGVYYNAYSEDLFVWDNDEEHDNENIKLKITKSALDQFIKKINDETPIREKLAIYNPKYDFKLNPIKDDNPELGWASIKFFLEDSPEKQIKISRGEERIFVWCFFLALFEIEGWADKQNEHFFIDDPVSSLDDHNIYITAKLILDLIEKNCDTKKIILTTHHMGLFSILQDWLSKGENSSKFKNKRIDKQTKGNIVKEKEIIEDKYLIRFLESNNDKSFKLIGRKKGTVLYHLLLLQIINEAKEQDNLFTYHFVLLRQVIESIASFLGEGRFSYVLDKLNIKDPNTKADIINSLSHEKIYTQKLSQMNDENKKLFITVFEEILIKFPFSLK